MIAVASVCVGGCGHRSTAEALPGGDTITHEATLLTVFRTPHNGYIAEVANPWNPSETLARYQIVERGADVDAVDGAELIYVPVERSLVYSGVHAGVVDELGESERITAIADAQYFTLESIKKRLKAGTVADCGSSMSPDIERVAACSPEIIVTSPYNNAGYGAVEHLPAVIVEMADYMEPTPGARAEWVKLLGLLYGCYDRADSLYRATMQSYRSLSALTSGLESKPKIITETPGTSGIWALPGGGSYMARMLCDAGAEYPWASTPDAGSLQLDFTQVIDKARDADVWLIRTLGTIKSLEDLKKEYPLNERFKAFADGNVWVCDTRTTPLFDIFPFHPDVLLREYIKILHPTLIDDGSTRFYERIH